VEVVAEYGLIFLFGEQAFELVKYVNLETKVQNHFSGFQGYKNPTTHQMGGDIRRETPKPYQPSTPFELRFPFLTFF
jgi:hypothetical protein